MTLLQNLLFLPYFVQQPAEEGRGRDLKKKVRDFTATHKVQAFAADGREWTWPSNPKHSHLSVCRSCWYLNSAEGCLVFLCLGLADLTVSLDFLSSSLHLLRLLKCLSKPFSLLRIFIIHWFLNPSKSSGIEMWTSYYQLQILIEFFLIFYLFYFVSFTYLSELLLVVLDAVH